MPTDAIDRGVAARAWCRADLAVGTLDIWPLGLLHPGARTVNVALDLTVEVELEPSADAYRVRQGESMVEGTTSAELAAHEETALIGLVLQELASPPVEVTIRSDSPRGGGLGASSALAVAVIAAAEELAGGTKRSAQERAALARDLEARLMSLPTGRQDHFPAQLGGVLEVRHEPGGEQVRRVETDLGALADSLLVVYSGQSHFSAGHNWQVIRNRLDGDGETTRCLDGICEAAAGVVEALEDARLADAGVLMSREWSWRRRLADGISTAKIEDLLAVAAEAGAWGGKVCGAGGGGCLVMLCPATARGDVETALAERGAEVLSASPARRPLQIWSLDRVRR